MALVSRWDFDGALTDSVGANHGTAVGGPLSFTDSLVTSELSGQALDLNGSTQAVSVANHASLQVTSAFWLTAWVRRDSEAQGVLFAKGTWDYWLLFNAGNGLEVGFTTSGGSEKALLAATDVLPGRVYRVDGVFTGSKLKLFVNGRLLKEASVTGTARATTGALLIGDGPGSWNFDGRLDKARLGNTAPSDAEVLAAYREESSTVFEDGFETGDLSRWATQQLVGAGAAQAVVSSEPAPHSGTRCLRSTLTSGDERAEIFPGHIFFSAGDDIYLRTRVLIRSGFPNSSKFAVLWQLRDEGDGSPVIALEVVEGKLRLIGGPATGLAETVFWVGPAPDAERWYDVVARIVCSEDAKAGKVALWLDGAKQALLTDTAKTAIGKAYPKFGLYRHTGITGTGVVAHDAISISRIAPILPPVPTAAPSITGTAVVGATLECSDGTWENEPDSYAYQWQRSATGSGGWSNIGGATASSYKLTGADEGDFLRCIVTATNEVGSAEAATAATAEVGPEPAAAPVAVTGAATGITPVKATLNGTVDPNNAPTTYWFEYGETEAYGAKVPVTEDGDAGEGSEAVAVSEAIKGLKPNTTYHFRLVAENAEGEAFGEDAEFTTGKPIRAAVTREYPPDRLAWHVNPPGGAPNRWASDEPDPANVIDDITTTSEMNGGYKEAAGLFPRDPHHEYSDLAPYADVSVYEPGVEEVWNGRFEKGSEESGERQSIKVECAGWWNALDDDKGAILGFINRDLSGWGEPSTERRLAINTGRLLSGTNEVGWRGTGETPPGVAQELQEINGGKGRIAEAWWNGGRVPLGALKYDRIERGGTGLTGDEFWKTIAGLVTNDDDGEEAGDFKNHKAANAEQQTVMATNAARYYARLFLLRSSTSGTPSTDLWNVTWENICLLSRLATENLALQGEWPNVGYTAKQMLQLAVPLYASPLQVTDESLEDDGFVIPQAWFAEPGPMSAVVNELTRYGLLRWYVYEDKLFQLRFRENIGRTWIIRSGESNLEEVGVDAQRLWRSLIVQWQDVDGSTRTAGPPGSGAEVEDARLEVTDPDHPAVIADLFRRDVLNLGGIATQEPAIEAGARFLEEANELDRAGQAQLVDYIEDDKTVMRPAAQVKAGDKVIVADSGDRSPREITSCSYSHRDRTASVSLDAPPEGVAALLERFKATLTALNL